IDASRRHNVTLQIIPFDKGGYTATGGAFTLLRFNDSDLPDIVYIEHLTSAVYLDKREEVDGYVVTMDAVSITAAQPRQTEAILRRAIEQLDED
ncbi:MAG TPA: Scr1 family TA system antitoxin-like transcriptional regulator, partial [Kribbella sp.]